MNCDDGNICTQDACIPEDNEMLLGGLSCRAMMETLPVKNDHRVTMANVLQVRQKTVMMEMHALRILRHCRLGNLLLFIQ